MKTSIILGSYNGEKYIEKQIESFFSQTLLPSELIVADDGSVDNTVEIIKRLSEQSPFKIKLIQNVKNLGYTTNFEQLLEKADGDIIFFSDQDDEWFPQKLETIVNEFKNHPDEMVVINDMILADGDLKPTEFTQLTNIRKIGMSDHTFVAGCAVAIRKEWKSVVLPFPENYEGHDNWICRLAEITGRKKILETPLQLYRRHDNNVSQSFSSQTKEMNEISAAWTHGLASAESAWLKELEKIKLTKQRLLDRKDAFSDQKALDKAIKDSDYKILIYEKRINNVRKSRIKRIMPLSIMFFKGDYKFFKGIKSYIKDLIRE